MPFWQRPQALDEILLVLSVHSEFPDEISIVALKSSIMGMTAELGQQLAK